ncbi:MAG: transglutaminase family protein [Acidimicrobiales bacterium]|jgi:transglutaminase-like putative cysteine protease|nr:transglutaminase family protein [Acidimicrobiales bacterium]
MRFRVVHRTEYRYTNEVSVGHSIAHLLPRSTEFQRCRAGSVVIEPRPDDKREHTDYFGNRVVYFSLQDPHDHLSVRATSEIEVWARDVPEPPPTPWDEVRDALRSSTARELLAAREYVLPSPLVPVTSELAAYAAPSFTPGRPLAEAVVDLARRIHDEFVYEPGATSVATPVADVLAHRRGVCQDFAHLAIGCVRAMGLAARYVSGYLETEPPPGAEKLVGADASHAWVSVLIPGWGWLDLDPTNDVPVDDRHLVVAHGRDFGDVTPLKGVVFSRGGDHELIVAVDVTRID